MRRCYLMLVMVGMVFLAGCQGPNDGLEITEARVGAPTGPNAALYFTVVNHGEADRLIGAISEVAERAELHETRMGDDGTMSMAAVAGIDAATDQTVVLEPGGLHVMLLGVDRLVEGDSVDVTLQWEVAGDIVVEAEVVSPAETMDHEGH